MDGDALTLLRVENAAEITAGFNEYNPPAWPESGKVGCVQGK